VNLKYAVNAIIVYDKFQIIQKLKWIQGYLLFQVKDPSALWTIKSIISTTITKGAKFVDFSVFITFP
jgi:hypothetical protein